MSWLAIDARTELKKLLSDDEKDKFSYRKEVFGELNGTNTVFKTLETRRYTDFSDVMTAPPVGVYLNNVFINPSDVVDDFTVEGQFELATPPQAGDTLRASYYFKWFLDDELDQFIVQGTEWCLAVSNIDAVPDGLKPAVLHYAAAEGYQKLAIRWARRLSEEYRVEDATDEERFKIVDVYKKSADSERKIAQTFRQNFYERNDQARAPLFATNFGFVRRVQPKR